MKNFYVYLLMLSINTLTSADNDNSNQHQAELQRKFDHQTDRLLASVKKLNEKISESDNLTEDQIKTLRSHSSQLASSLQNTLDRMFLRKTLTEKKNSQQAESQPLIVLINSNDELN